MQIGVFIDFEDIRIAMDSVWVDSDLTRHIVRVRAWYEQRDGIQPMEHFSSYLRQWFLMASGRYNFPA